MRISFVTLLAPAVLVGCAAGDNEATFAEVKADLADRSPHAVVWRNNADHDRRAEAAVADLLTGPLTAETAVRLALLNNRALQATYEELGIAQADVAQAGAFHNPVLDGEVKYPSSGGPAVELSLVTNFLDLLYIPMRKAIAEASLDSAKVRVAGAALDTAYQAQQTFIEYQAAEQSLELRRSALLATAASYELAQRIRAAGNITALNLARERSFHEEARLETAAAEMMVAEKREQLCRVLGLWGSQTAFTIEPRLPGLPAEQFLLDDVEPRAIAASIELAESRLAIINSLRQVGITKPLGWLSELELGVAFERESDGAKSVGPAFSLPLPLFSQGQPATARAEAHARQVAALHYARAVDVRSAARVAARRLLIARQRAEHYQKVVVPLQHAIVDETQKEYNAMLVGGFELIEAKRAEIDAGRGYVDSLQAYWLARNALDLILAGRLPAGSLESTHSDDSASTARTAREGH